MVVPNQLKLFLACISGDIFLTHNMDSVVCIQVFFLLEPRLMEQDQSETLLVIVVEGREDRAN